MAPAKDIYMLHALTCVDSACVSESLKVYSDRYQIEKWEQEVVQSFYDDRYVDHVSIRKNPDNYILCSSFFDMKHLLDIKPNGGTYINSSCEAFNE